MANLAKYYDCNRNETYAIDLGTTNTSFIQTHQELKALGVKNNAFMLKIIDRDLVGVNPYDPNLDDRMKYKIQIECIRNFWYYVREVARVPITNSDPVPLYLHRATAAQFWLFAQRIDSTLNIPRRCYKTSNTLAGPYCWSYNFGLKNGNMVMFNYSNDQVAVNLNTMKDMLDALPEWMHYSAIEVENPNVRSKTKTSLKKKKDAVKSIKHAVNNNTITTRGKAVNSAAAMKFGRGSAINVPYFDEAEYIDFLPDILAASGPSYGEALNMAKKTGAIACRLFTTTPGYKSNPQQRNNYEKFISIQPVWTEKLYDMTYDEIIQYMHDNGNGTTEILYIEYNYIQCRRDDAWLDDMLVRLNGDRLRLRTEVLLQRLSADENGPFDPYDVDYIIQSKKDPIGSILVNTTYRFDIYDHLDKNANTTQMLDSMIPYFIGIDPATGVGGDNTAIVGINPYNLKPAFEFGSSYISEPKVVSLIVSLVRMLPNSIVFIETRSSGSAIIALIRESYPDVAARLYKSEYDPNKVYIKENIDQQVTESERREAIQKKLYGIATGETSRKQIQDLWVEYIHEYKSVITSNHVVSEISTMTKTATNKIVASNGSHDDYIMAWGFCLWGYHHGQSLFRWGFVKPDKHPLEKDKMPQKLKDPINKLARMDVNAILANKANISVINDAKKFEWMQGAKINGYRRTIQLVNPNGVYQGSGEDNWVDSIESGHTEYDSAVDVGIEDIFF